MDDGFPYALADAGGFYFPDPELTDKQGLVAIGGNLQPERILAAYRQGIFPWFAADSPILWWSPNPRLILKPTAFKLTRSLRQALKKPYRFSFDTAFTEVITACATVQERKNNTWITSAMLAAYTQLHNMGYAHSVELWHDNQLIGGLYGISLGRAFFGESMFHQVRDASKLALYHLCQALIAWQFDFIDCQIPTAHLHRLGAITISRHDFLQQLQQTLHHPTQQGRWQA